MNFYVVTRIFSLTSSTTAVSLMWIAGALPCLLFAPFSGPVVDGVSKRKSMIVTNLLQAASISLLFFVSKPFSFYSVVFLYWFFDQIYMPSQQAATPQLVDKKLLPAANGLFLLTQQASLLVGFGGASHHHSRQYYHHRFCHSQFNYCCHGLFPAHDAPKAIVGTKASSNSERSLSVTNSSKTTVLSCFPYF